MTQIKDLINLRPGRYNKTLPHLLEEQGLHSYRNPQFRADFPPQEPMKNIITFGLLYRNQNHGSVISRYTCPVGLPGFITTSPLTTTPIDREPSSCFFRSDMLTPQPLDSSR